MTKCIITKVDVSTIAIFSKRNVLLSKNLFTNVLKIVIKELCGTNENQNKPNFNSKFVRVMRNKVINDKVLVICRKLHISQRFRFSAVGRRQITKIVLIRKV